MHILLVCLCPHVSIHGWTSLYKNFMIATFNFNHFPYDYTLATQTISNDDALVTITTSLCCKSERGYVLLQHKLPVMMMHLSCINYACTLMYICVETATTMSVDTFM